MFSILFLLCKFFLVLSILIIMVDYKEFLQGDSEKHNLLSYTLLKGLDKNTFQKYAKRIYCLAEFYKIDEKLLINAVKELTQYDNLSLHDVLYLDYKKAVARVKRKNNLKDFKDGFFGRIISYDFLDTAYLAEENPHKESSVMFYVHEILSGKFVDIDGIKRLPKYKCWYKSNDFYVSSSENALLKICLNIIGEHKMAERIDLMYFFNSKKNRFSLGYNIYSQEFDSGFYDNTHDTGLVLYLLEEMDTQHLKSYFVRDYDLQILQCFRIRGIGKVSEQSILPQLTLREYSDNENELYTNVNGEWAILCDACANISIFHCGKLEYEFYFGVLDYNFDRVSHGFFSDKIAFVFRGENCRLVVEITNNKIAIIKKNIKKVYTFCNKKIADSFEENVPLNMKIFKGDHAHCKYSSSSTEFHIPFTFGDVINNHILQYADSCESALVIFEKGEKAKDIKQCLTEFKQLQSFGYSIKPILFFKEKPPLFKHDFEDVSCAFDLEKARKACSLVINKRLMENKYFGKINRRECSVRTYNECNFPIKSVLDRCFYCPEGLMEYNEFRMSNLKILVRDTQDGSVYSPVYIDSERYVSGRMNARQGVISYCADCVKVHLSAEIDLQKGICSLNILNNQNKTANLYLCVRYFDESVFCEHVNLHARKNHFKKISLFHPVSEYEKIHYSINFNDINLRKYFSELAASFIFSAESLIKNNSPLALIFYGFASVYLCPSLCRQIILNLSTKQTVKGNVKGGVNYLFCILAVEYMRVTNDYNILKRETAYCDCGAKDSLKYHLLKAINMIPKTKTQKLLRFIALKKFIDNTELLQDRAKILKGLNKYKSRILGGCQEESVLYRIIKSMFYLEHDSLVYLGTRIDKEVKCLWRHILSDYDLSRENLCEIIETPRYFNRDIRNDILSCIMIFHICKNVMSVNFRNGYVDFETSSPYRYDYFGNIKYGENKIKIKRGSKSNSVKINNIQVNTAMMKFTSDKGYVSVDIGT